MILGYARVSTDDQSLDAQLDALARAGVERTREGLDAARARGRIGGRPAALSPT